MNLLFFFCSFVGRFKVCNFTDAHSEIVQNYVQSFKGLTVEKSKGLSLVFVIASIALISWTVLVVVAENGAFVSKGTSWISDCPSLVGVTKSDGFYNISFDFSSMNYSRQLQNMIINPNSQGAVNGLTGNINGTVVNGTDPVFKYCLKSGDSLQVSLRFPCADFVSGTTIDVQVLGDCFGSGGTILLP